MRNTSSMATRLTTCGVAIMAKASEPGRTKTRLVPPLTYDEASALNTVFIQDVASNIIAASQSRSIAGYVAFGPPGSESFFNAILPSEIGLFESWHQNFGDCLFSAIEQLISRGHLAAMVLNSDGPSLPTSLLIQAAETLAQPGDRAVLGPADDGGYYLLGLKGAHRRLFEDIDWSTNRVAKQTLTRAAEIGLPVHILATWYDVDDTSTLMRLRSELFDADLAGEGLIPYNAVATKNLLRRFLADSGFCGRMRWGDAPPVKKVAP